MRYGTHQYCLIKIQHYELEQLLQKFDFLHRFINSPNFKNLVTNMISFFQLAIELYTLVLENKKWEIK